MIFLLAIAFEINKHNNGIRFFGIFGNIDYENQKKDFLP